MNEYTLSPVEFALIAELQKAVQECPAQLQLNGALLLIARQQGLQGSLRLDGNKLVVVTPGA
jgi:hypothetical protein